MPVVMVLVGNGSWKPKHFISQTHSDSPTVCAVSLVPHCRDSLNYPHESTTLEREEAAWYGG